MSAHTRWLVLATGGLLLSACKGDSGADAPRDSLAQRKIDSAIGASALPGAAGVTGALTGADSAAARAARLDSLNKQP
jgi:hypothetical protein